MLNIYLGDMENAIYHPPVYFDNTYEDEWITDELSVKMIINLHHIMDFGKDFEAKILNTGEIVHSMAEFISVAGKYV